MYVRSHGPTRTIQRPVHVWVYAYTQTMTKILITVVVSAAVVVVSALETDTLLSPPMLCSFFFLFLLITFSHRNSRSLLLSGNKSDRYTMCRMVSLGGRLLFSEGQNLQPVETNAKTLQRDMCPSPLRAAQPAPDQLTHENSHWRHVAWPPSSRLSASASLFCPSNWIYKDATVFNSLFFSEIT